MPDGTSTARQLRPKLATILREGYSLAFLRKDATAGLTVAIVALPLSMAIAVASGVGPERGLYTAIVGGFVVSALSGSRFQIGGPAGAFIVLVAATVARFGVEGLLLTVLMSGLMLSQLKDLGGLRLTAPEPGPLLPKLAALASALPTLAPAALSLGVGSAALIFVLRRYRPAWPGMLIAVAAASAAASSLHLSAATIGSRFGGLPHGLPIPRLPVMNLHLALQLLPMALSFTLLGGIESLLSAKVADSMTGRKHRSNMELIAQGLANVVSALFGGISVTGTIARTATNIRAGGVTPISGMLHSAFLLLFILIAAPLASFVPLAALAGVLVVVSWNMAEKAEFARLLRNWRTAAVLLATFGLTLVRDLTSGIVAGCVLAALFAMLKRPVPEEGDGGP
jgi:SulP family sulfate permease